MKRSSKILLLVAALFTASGVAAAGYRYNCDGQGPHGYGPARMQGMPGPGMHGQYGPGRGMHRQFGPGRGMPGQFGPGRGMRGGGPGGDVIYQLDNLSDEQKRQISELREQHRAQMATQRAEMKDKINAVLSEEQLQQLRQLRPWH